jgi:hypothetical protein
MRSETCIGRYSSTFLDLGTRCRFTLQGIKPTCYNTQPTGIGLRFLACKMLPVFPFVSKSPRPALGPTQPLQ